MNKVIITQMNSHRMDHTDLKKKNRSLLDSKAILLTVETHSRELCMCL